MFIFFFNSEWGEKSKGSSLCFIWVLLCVSAGLSCKVSTLGSPLLQEAVDVEDRRYESRSEDPTLDGLGGFKTVANN